MKNHPFGSGDLKRVPFRDRMGQRDIADFKRAQRKRLAVLDNVKLYLLQQIFLFQLFPHQFSGKGGGVNRAFQLWPQVGDGADVVLVAMGQNQPQQVLLAFFYKAQVRENQVDAGQGFSGKAGAEIDHQPFAQETVKIEVHADLARPAQRHKQQIRGFPGPVSHWRPAHK